MKLTKTQIDDLYLFTDKHHVKYYDLQTELVDHLAQDIENQWEENPKITFEEGLKRAFRKFGIFGFEDVVNEKRNALMKRYRKWNREILKSYFKLPQIVGVIFSIYLVFNLFILANKNPVLNISIKTIVVILALIILTISFIQFYKIKKNKKDKKFMMEEIIFNHGLSFNLSIISLVFQFFSYSIKQTNYYWVLTNSVIFVLILLISYIYLIKIPRDANKYLKETYPYWDMV